MKSFHQVTATAEWKPRRPATLNQLNPRAHSRYSESAYSPITGMSELREQERFKALGTPSVLSPLE